MSGLVDAPGAADLIRSARRILFFLHVSPDGDAIGSTLAMTHAVRRMGKEAWIVGVDPVPEIYHFLPGWDSLFRPWEQISGAWDLAVFLDCGDRSRVGAAEPLLSTCKVTLNVDHHTTNSQFGDHNYLDFSAAAVGEQVYHLLRALGADIDHDIAVCVYTAIVTDTGQFKYESTAPDTHRIAAALLEAGVQPYAVAEPIFESESVARTRLLAQALSTLQLHNDGAVATLRVTQDMLMACGATDDDVDGLVNHARAIRGVEVGILSRVLASGDVRVNLRSRRTVDVGQLAQRFGGGGHARAAGFSATATLDEVEAAVVQAVVQELGRGAGKG